jgi:hypothetical protein
MAFAAPCLTLPTKFAHLPSSRRDTANTTLLFHQTYTHIFTRPCHSDTDASSEAVEVHRLRESYRPLRARVVPGAQFGEYLESVAHHRELPE